MWQKMRAWWDDDRGAINTVEIIGYSVLVVGAAALVGYAFTAASRGKAGAMVDTLSDLKAMNDVITDTDTPEYDYTATNTHTDTGIITGATGD